MGRIGRSHSRREAPATSRRRATVACWLPALIVCLALLLPTVTLSDNTFQIGIVYSATGGLVDSWSESVNGTRMWLRQLTDVLGPSGLRITDGAGNTMSYTFNLTTADDASSADTHYNLVAGMVAGSGGGGAGGGVDFLFNGQPAFAVNESMTVDTAKRINIHGFTGNDEVFARDLKGVFGVSQSNRFLTSDLMNEYRVASIFSVMFVYRDDIPELRSACEAAIATAQTVLLKVTRVIKYQGSDAATMANVSQEISATTTEVLVGCSLSNEAAQLVKLIDQLKKPLKSIVFTNGPLTPSFSAGVGSLSQYLMSPAPWFQTLPLSDPFYGKASDFAVKYTTLFGDAPTYVAAGTAAAGLVLQQALQAAFSSCNISATGGDVKKLLYSTNLLNCSDNNNNGRLRLISAMQLASVNTFYGDISFDKFRQNYASAMKVMQVFQTVSNLKQVLLPAVVIPLSDATMAKKSPQPNRYAPVCQPGTYAGPDQFLPCIPCVAGSFQEFAGRTSCELCPRSTYQNATGKAACLACPENSETSLRGATTPYECTCKANYWTNERKPGVPCLECPINSECAGGVALPQPDFGWYAEPEDPAVMFNCNPNYICEGNFKCAEGYAGRMCAYCAPGYYMAFTRCWACSSPVANVVAMLAMYVFFFLLNVSVSRSFESFHVLMNFCQYLSVINAFNVNWPNTLNIIMNYMSVLSFEMDVIQPQCAVPTWSFEMNLYVQVIAPAAILLLVLLWTGFTWVCYRVKLRILGRSGTNQGSAAMSSTSSMHMGSINPITGSMAMDAAATSSWWLLLQTMVQIPSDHNEMRELFLDRMSIPLMFLNIGYLALLKYLLAAFYCFDFVGTSYIYYSPNDLCYTPKHYKMMMVATTGLIVYVGGLWFMVIHVLRHLRRTRDFGGKKPLLLFGWLYERYKAEYHWYEVIQMGQKTIYVLVVVFLLPDPVLQVLVCLVLSIGCAMIDVQTAAMVSNAAHVTQTMADAALSALLVLGLVFFNNAVLPRTTQLCYYMSLFLVIGILGVLMLYVLMECVLEAMITVLMARHNKIAKKWGHNIKQFKHMYDVFEPIFMVRWLFKAQAEDWMQWHKLCIMLQSTVHPTNETSYLSIKKIGRFWRYLLENFPETVDFLVTCEPEHRENFAMFAEVMFAQFFDSQEELPVQLNMVVADKHKAGLSQWLSAAEETEIQFVRMVMTNAFGRARGENAKQEIARALSRSQRGSQHGNKLGRDSDWGALSVGGGGDPSMSGFSRDFPYEASVRNDLGVRSNSSALNDPSGRLDAGARGDMSVRAESGVRGVGGKNFAQMIRAKTGRESATGIVSPPLSPSPLSHPSVVPATPSPLARPSLKSALSGDVDEVSPFDAEANAAEINKQAPVSPVPRAPKAALRFLDEHDQQPPAPDGPDGGAQAATRTEGGEQSSYTWPNLRMAFKDDPAPEAVPADAISTRPQSEEGPAPATPDIQALTGIHTIGGINALADANATNGSSQPPYESGPLVRLDTQDLLPPPAPLSPRPPPVDQPLMRPAPPATTPPTAPARAPLPEHALNSFKRSSSRISGLLPERPATAAQELAAATQELLADLQQNHPVPVSPRPVPSPRARLAVTPSSPARLATQHSGLSVDAMERLVSAPATLDMEAVMEAVERETERPGPDPVVSQAVPAPSPPSIPLTASNPAYPDPTSPPAGEEAATALVHAATFAASVGEDAAMAAVEESVRASVGQEATAHKGE